MPAVKRSREERIALAARKKKAFRLKQPHLLARSRRVSVPRGMTNTGPSSGFPPRKIVTLKYCQQVPITANLTGTIPAAPSGYFHYPTQTTALQAGHRDFRCNSPHGPNLDATPNGQAHQPRDWDTYVSFYRNYKVIKSKIIVTFTQSPLTIAENHNPTQVGITRLESTTNANAYVLRQQMMEDPSTRHGVICDESSKVTLYNNWASKSVADDDGAHTALTNADPNDQDTYVIWAAENLAGQNTVNRQAYVECLVTILYTVELYNRKQSQLN